MIAENRSWKISVALHVALFLIAAFGLPVLLPDMEEPQPMVMTVDILPISAMTNVKPSDKPIQEKKATAKPLPKPKEQPKPKPMEKEEVKEKQFDPTEEAELVDKEKPKPKEEEKKEEPKKEDDFEKLLKDLEKQAEPVKEKGKDQTAQEENKTISDAPYDATQPLSLSEEDALRSAYIPCWSPPAGGMDSEKQVVVMRAQYRPDGVLIDAQLDSAGGQKSRYNSDVAFRTAADAAMRAVRHPTCNPLKNLPTSVYAKLKDTKITFDPRTMLQ